MLLKGGLVLRRKDGAWVAQEEDILVDGPTIVEVAPRGTRSLPANCQIIDMRQRLIIPGLVNAHTHSYASFQRGMFEKLPLELWVPMTVAARSGDPRAAYLSAALTAIDALRNGTTALMDHLPASSLEELEAAVEAYSSAGIRARVAPAVFDRPYLSTVDPEAPSVAVNPAAIDQAVRLTEQFLALHGSEGLIGAAVGPSAPQRCTEELLMRLSSLAREARVPLHTHLLETFAQRRMLDSLTGGDLLGYLERTGLLIDGVSFAHCVWLTRAEAGGLAQRGAVAVHNPFSNLYLGSGIAPIPDFVTEGLPVALGTDGANCGGSQSMLASLKLASVLHRQNREYLEWLDAGFWLNSATAVSARCLFLQQCDIRAGCPADLVAIDLGRAVWAPLNDPLNQLVYQEWGAHVDKVFVAGRLVVDGGDVLGLKEAKVVDEACSLAEALADSVGRRLAEAQAQLRAAEAIYRRIHGLSQFS
jgi:cytosine/adenosine deaminase-related metal-dependent hydrolase